MEVEVRHLEILIEQLFAKAKLPVHDKGFGKISELIGGDVTKKYLYESISVRCREAKKKKVKTIKLRDDKLNTIAQYLECDTFRIFLERIETPPDPVLKNLVGNYYSYVRRNDDKAKLLRSPVSVTEEKGKFLLELKGPTWSYKGEIKLRHGCLFILMESSGGKMIHHVYKIGARQKPKVLQGIFSGVSTNFDPIGGRTVLIRMNSEFNALSNKESAISDFQRSKIEEEQAVAKYLKDYSLNNLKINRVVTFGIDDLSV